MSGSIIKETLRRVLRGVAGYSERAAAGAAPEADRPTEPLPLRLAMAFLDWVHLHAWNVADRIFRLLAWMLALSFLNALLVKNEVAYGWVVSYGLIAMWCLALAGALFAALMWTYLATTKALLSWIDVNSTWQLVSIALVVTLGPGFLMYLATRAFKFTTALMLSVLEFGLK